MSPATPEFAYSDLLDDKGNDCFADTTKPVGPTVRTRLALSP